MLVNKYGCFEFLVVRSEKSAVQLFKVGENKNLEFVVAGQWMDWIEFIVIVHLGFLSYIS